MPYRSEYRELDRLMHGNLHRFLVAQRRRYASDAEIALTIRDRYGVTISGQSVRRWLYEAGIPTRKEMRKTL